MMKLFLNCIDAWLMNGILPCDCLKSQHVYLFIWAAGPPQISQRIAYAFHLRVAKDHSITKPHSTHPNHNHTSVNSAMLSPFFMEYLCHVNQTHVSCHII